MRSKSIPILIVLSGGLLCGSLASATSILPTTVPAAATKKQQNDLHEMQLPNGMRILVKEDHRAPVIVSQVWYKTGSVDEQIGTTGVAHVLEHMMFKGTHRYPEGQFSKIIAKAGGRENAFTTRDYTVYFQQLHKDKLGLALELEADRMVNLNLKQKEFDKELNVVKEERRLRTEDKPQALLYETYNATAYQSHPYRHPVIGWMADLHDMQLADLKQWYQTWYSPNNAVLIIAGDVKPQDVFQLAKKHFGALKPVTLPVRKNQEEVKQVGQRQVTLKAPAKLNYFIMGYHVPVIRDVEKDWEPYALDMLSSILDGHDAARLSENLVQKQQLASEVDVSYDLISRGPGQFIIDATPLKNHTALDVKNGILAEIEKIKKQGVTEQELERVRSQLIASRIFQRDSIFYEAMQMGSAVMTGFKPTDIDRIIDKLKAVTPQQIQEVAQKYLTEDNLTIAILDPQPLDSKSKSAPYAETTGRSHGY